MSDSPIANLDGKLRPLVMPRATRPLISVLTLDELLNRPLAAWFIEGIAHCGDLLCVFGTPSNGKTLVVVDLAVSVALDEPWLGRNVQHGRVVYITAEGQASFGDRIRAALRGRGVGGETARDNLAFIFTPLNLLDPITADDLIEAVKGAGPTPTLIVVDPLARYFGPGDENTARDMNLFVGTCDRLRDEFGATVIAVHHSGSASNRPRGSTALDGAVDVLLHVCNANGRLTVTSTKTKDAAGMKPAQAEIVVEQVSSKGVERRESVRIRYLGDAGKAVVVDDRADSKVLAALEQLGKPASVNELVEASGVSKPHASRTLKKLAESDVRVDRQKSGKQLLYSMRPTAVPTAPSHPPSHDIEAEQMRSSPCSASSHHSPPPKGGDEKKQKGNILALGTKNSAPRAKSKPKAANRTPATPQSERDQGGGA